MNEPSVVLMLDDDLHVVSVLPLGRTSEETERIKAIIDKMLEAGDQCGCRCGGKCDGKNG